MFPFVYHLSLVLVVPRALSWGPVSSLSIYFLFALFFCQFNGHFCGYRLTAATSVSSTLQIPSVFPISNASFFTPPGAKSLDVIISIPHSFQANITACLPPSTQHEPPFPHTQQYCRSCSSSLHIPSHLEPAAPALTLSAQKGTYIIMILIV